MAVILLLALFAAPYWEEKSPAQWTDEELKTFLRGSPWAQVDRIRIRGSAEIVDNDSGDVEAPESGVQAFLASAGPMREAEAEWRRRHPPKGDAAEDEYANEFHEFIRVNAGNYIALAVRVARPQALEKKKEIAEMEKRCELRIGKRRYKLVGHFLPSPGDLYLRLVFPRDVRPGDEELEFSLYLPGVALPFRELTFRIDRLLYKGKPEL